jgi:hypothetical protein
LVIWRRFGGAGPVAFPETLAQGVGLTVLGFAAGAVGAFAADQPLGRVTEHLGGPLAVLGPLGINRGLHALAQVVRKRGRANAGRGGPGSGLGGTSLALRQRAAAAFFGHLAPQRSAQRDDANRTVQRSIRRTANSSLMMNRNATASYFACPDARTETELPGESPRKPAVGHEFWRFRAGIQRVSLA